MAHSTDTPKHENLDADAVAEAGESSRAGSEVVQPTGEEVQSALVVALAHVNPDANPDANPDLAAAETKIERTNPKANANIRLSLMDRVEAAVQRLSARSHFWHRVCSLIWLPYAYKSGIRMVKRVGEDTFMAELPFRPFNRNWYNAMAGASLLANSEIAGGMYIFRQTEGAYTIVCKELTYKFLRPCFGPALYKVVPREDLQALIATKKEFNLTVDLEIVQQAVVPAAVARQSPKRSLIARMGAKERRVGVCIATFHLTPTLHQKAKRGDTRAVGSGPKKHAR